MRTILLATSNPNKLAEVRQILAPAELEVISLESIGADLEEPVEDGPSFEANARIKALYYAERTGQSCLADDSGLEVDALGGDPGVLSARYSGVEGSRLVRDRANNQKLVQALSAVPVAERHARFVCAMCFADPDGRILHETMGKFEGLIVDLPRGENGFGYDPHFLVPEFQRTSAELSPEQKNRLSHRGKATTEMLRLIDSDGT